MQDNPDPEITQQQLMNLFGKEEELDEELAAWIEDSHLKHPLVYSIFHHPIKNAHVNQYFQYKKRAVAEARNSQEWTKYIYLHERPYRVDAFSSIEENLSDEQYWELLETVWTDSENIYQNYEMWLGLLESERPERILMTTEEFRSALTMPTGEGGFAGELTIFRGYQEDPEYYDRPGMEGLSWTLNIEKAVWFARRLQFGGRTPMLATAKVQRDDIIAFIMSREESEIIANPEHLIIEKVQDLS